MSIWSNLHLLQLFWIKIRTNIILSKRKKSAIRNQLLSAVFLQLFVRYLILGLTWIATNGFGLAEGGEFEIPMLKFTIMFNRIPKAQTYYSAPLLANPCCRKFFYLLLFVTFVIILYKILIKCLYLNNSIVSLGQSFF